MVGMTFKPYQKGDVHAVKIRDGDYFGEPVTDLPGSAWTLKIKGEVIACFGLHYELGRVATLWAYVSDDARGHGVAGIRFARQLLKDAFEVLKFNRIQAVVIADKPEYSRFIELLGFEKEGTLRMATEDGRDLFMYSRIKE